MPEHWLSFIVSSYYCLTGGAVRPKALGKKTSFTGHHMILGLLVVAGAENGKSKEQNSPLGKGNFFVDREGNIRVFESAVIRNDVFSTGDLWIGKGAVIEGNASADGDLIMERDSRVAGSIRVKGSVNFKQNALVLGEVEIGGSVYRGNNPPEHLFRRKYPAPQGEDFFASEGSDLEADVSTLLEGRKLKGGVVTVIHEKRSEISYAILRRMSSEGSACMIIGREPPERLQSTRGIRIDDENVIWLTNLVGRRCVNPTHLSSVLNALTRFLDGNRRGLVLLDGVEYLITNNGFDQVLKFINKIEDMIITSGITVLVTVDPRTLDAQNLALIERGAETILSMERQSDEKGLARQELEEMLKEETVRRQQLEDRLDGYLYRIESAISTAQARPPGESRNEAEIKELEGARDTIRTELRTLEQRMEEKERELLETLDRKIGEIREGEGRKDLVATMEEQLRENSELLLKAVLLAERLSTEKLQRSEDSQDD